MRRLHYRAARLAVEAMREPTEAMCEAATSNRYQTIGAVSAGSFGSRPDRLDRLEAVFGEVLETLNHFMAEPTDNGQSCVAERREHLRGMSGMSTCLVLAAGDIAHVMKRVLYSPVVSRQRQ
jgi:hypothetical protein